MVQLPLAASKSSSTAIGYFWKLVLQLKTSCVQLGPFFMCGYLIQPDQIKLLSLNNIAWHLCYIGNTNMIVEHSMKWKSAYLNDHSRCVCLVWYGPSIHGWLIYYGHQEPGGILGISWAFLKSLVLYNAFRFMKSNISIIYLSLELLLWDWNRS
jgi:hypothetical protein